MLQLIAEPLGTEIIAIGRLKTFGITGVISNDTTSKPPIIHSDQEIAIIYIQGHGDWNLSLGILESCPDMRRGGIGWSSNYGISMNPHGTIRGN